MSQRGRQMQRHGGAISIVQLGTAVLLVNCCVHGAAGAANPALGGNVASGPAASASRETEPGAGQGNNAAGTTPPHVHKRGNGYNLNDPADMAALNGSGWWYNWGGYPDPAVLDTARQLGVEFVPMQWADWGIVTMEVSIWPDAKVLLGFNEPNHVGQANMQPRYAAQQWARIMEFAANRPGLRLGSPAAAPCGGVECNTCGPDHCWQQPADATAPEHGVKVWRAGSTNSRAKRNRQQQAELGRQRRRQGHEASAAGGGGSPAGDCRESGGDVASCRVASQDVPGGGTAEQQPGERCNCLLNSPFDWWDQFFGNCSELYPQGGCRVDFMATHYYACVPSWLQSYLGAIRSRYQRPVWLTEWACPLVPAENATEPEHQRNQQLEDGYMRQMADWMEATPWLERHAWFSVRAGGWLGPYVSLLAGPGELTPAGAVYNMQPPPTAHAMASA